MSKLRLFLRKIRFCIIVPLYHKLLIKRLKHKNEINVVFIASTLSMWRYQGIYELLSKHPRFRVSIALLPFNSYSKEQQKDEIIMLSSYFDSLGIKYYVGDENSRLDVRTQLNPDVLFYPQPYPGLYDNNNEYYNFRDKLLCYFPYGFWIDKAADWSYNELLHNYAWKLFYSIESHREDAMSCADNRGRNIVVVGYPNADGFLRKEHRNLWKPQNMYKKRIIWAPHYTIFAGGYLEQSNFLWMATFMLEIAEVYADRLQIVFKPHPRLISELYKHKDWGKDKAEEYYEEWSSRDNTQLETGDFIDLFMTSDAMIHDSGSFCVEYHYTSNPVMYIAENFEDQLEGKSDFGKKAMQQHYVGKCKDDIINFIENVVLKGDDPMRQGREEFYREYLLPPNGKTVAENTMDVFLKTFC